jgi:hypothetical protein
MGEIYNAAMPAGHQKWLGFVFAHHVSENEDISMPKEQ